MSGVELVLAFLAGVVMGGALDRSIVLGQHDPTVLAEQRASVIPDELVRGQPAERATDREVGVVTAVLVAGSEKAAAHRVGLSHSTVKHHVANARSKVGAETRAELVWILASLRLAEPDAADENSVGLVVHAGSPLDGEV